MSKLEDVIAGLRQGVAKQTSEWEYVIKLSRQYAQMVAHGTYESHSSSIAVHPADRQRYTDVFLHDMIEAVNRAYREDARLGAALANALATPTDE